jgi:tRNA (guanine-N7-)-methyltransferase
MQPRSQYYGRRSARRLTGSRIELLKTELAKYELRLPEADDAMLALEHTPLWLEIGFGSGEHLLEQAKAHQGKFFIGCEPFLNGVAALLRGLEANNLHNVRIFAEDARLLLARLPDASIERCFILFADPWPKARHNRRRIVNPETLDQFARILTPDGALYLATDHADLAAWYVDTVAAHTAFILEPASGEDSHIKPADWPATRYETKALGAGRQPVYYHVRRG